MSSKHHGKLIELKDGASIPSRGRAEWENGDLRQGKPQWKGPPPAKNKKPRLIPVFNDQTVQDAIRNHAVPASYRQPPEVNDELIEALSTGVPIAARFDLCVGNDKGVYPFFPLERFFGPPGVTGPIARGSILAYAGIVRTTERKWLDGVDRFGNVRTADVQVFKHTFITPLGRCIIHDFGLVQPA